MSARILTFPARAPAPKPDAEARSKTGMVLILPVVRIERCDPETKPEPPRLARRSRPSERLRFFGGFAQVSAALERHQFAGSSSSRAPDGSPSGDTVSNPAPAPSSSDEVSP